ncbi:MAG: efflux RND transporter periplasmic adaptor subunit [Phycisphaeraceae bacterium]|nr:efflux RND transporter periplasmic adaptor subunit [Phycisphaeraceae bacterium]
MWKWVVGGFVVVAAVCGGGGYLVMSSDAVRSAMNARAKPTEVRLEQASRRELVRTVSAPGTIEPRNRVMISAQVSARIKRLPHAEGDEVSGNDVLVELDDEELQAALESALANEKVQAAFLAEAEVNKKSAELSLAGDRARLEAAKAALEEATIEVGSIRELYDTEDVARTELSRAESQYQQALANVAVAQSAVDIAEQNVERAAVGVLGGQAAVEVAQATTRRARKDLDNATIRSPIAGTITDLPAEEGELVVIGTLNNPGSVLMQVADLTDMLLRARVDEANIQSVRERQSADVLINAYPDRVFSGTVERVGKLRKTHTDGTHYFEVEIKISLGEGQTLSSGLSATCEVVVETLPDALQVPSQAVLSRRIADLPSEVREGSTLINDRKTFADVVFQVRDGKAVAVPVRIGVSDLTSTQVLEGLDEGAGVIAGPFKILEGLSHGQFVSVVDSSGQPAEVAGAGEAEPAGS